MYQGVAYKRLKTMANRTTITPKGGCGHLQKVFFCKGFQALSRKHGGKTVCKY